jgi:hypothetical protein
MSPDATSPAPAVASAGAAVLRRSLAVAEREQRIQQRQIWIEVSRTRVLLAREVARLRNGARNAEVADRAEAEWLRTEARTMLAQGWTEEEMREIGFPQPLLASLRSVAPPSAAPPPADPDAGEAEELAETATASV